MRTRDAVIDYQATQKDTETYDEKLDLTDPVSALDIEVQCTNGSSYNKDNYISDIVTKVEIVDGSDVLVSASLTQLQALHYWVTGKPPLMFFSESAGGQQRGGARLLFGRKLWDPSYFMDFNRYKNPRLKITFNKAAIRPAAATAFATGDTILLTVVAKVMEEGAGGNLGFLMTKEIDATTLAGSGDKTVSLPTDYPYRLALLRAYLAGYDIDESISNIKLSCETGKFIPLDRKVKQLDAELFSQFGEITWQQNIFRKHGETVRTPLNKEPRIVGISTVPHVAMFPWSWSGNYYLDLFDLAGAAITTEEDLWTVQHGHCLHATLPLFFGLLDDPSSWFQAPSYKKLDLILAQGQAAAYSLVLQQLRT